MPSEAIPKTPVTWRDLSGEVAVIANAPGHFYPRPVSGGPSMPADDTALKYAPYAAEFEAWAVENAPPVFAALPPLSRDRYFSGKYGTGGPYEYVGVLLSFAATVSVLAQQITTWVQLGEYVVRLKRKWSGMFQRQGVPVGSSDRLVFTAPFIEALCIAHAFTAYGESRVGVAPLVEAVCRSEEHCTAAHPCGLERYTVQVHLGPVVYLYSVDGHGTPWEHLRIDRGSVTPLALPNFEDLRPAVGPG